MYPITCSKAFQCSSPGLLWKCERSETVNERSGCVASCPHITDPRMDWYGLSSIAFVSDSVFGDILFSRTIPVGRGTLCGVTPVWVPSSSLLSSSPDPPLLHHHLVFVFTSLTWLIKPRKNLNTNTMGLTVSYSLYRRAWLWSRFICSFFLIFPHFIILEISVTLIISNS